LDGGDGMKNILKSVREEKGMTISELARKAGVTRQTIYNIESNQNAVVSSNVMESIAKALDVKAKNIFLF
jgi:DNA-binding XRE family transcriptional regulator